MDIKILDSWLREHLKTDATYKDIAKYLTLCGPSIEKVGIVKNNGKNDYIYHIEVTTNRVDMMSVRGIAREAAVILPEFGFSAELIPLESDSGEKYDEIDTKITFKNNPKLVDRLMGVALKIDKIGKSPEWVVKRLEASGIRSLNAIVDITNYVMIEVGQPTHVFDFDLVAPYIGVRESKKGESVTSFDGKTHKLPGGDIVFENKSGEIIDLPGIIGTKNSVVNENTKRVLFFIDNNDPVRLRKTSMTLGIRTVAVTLNEKSVDPELAESALKRGIFLFKKLCSATQIGKIQDVYSNSPKLTKILILHDFIEKSLGVKIETKRVLRILNNLEINTTFDSTTNSYSCVPPSFRSKDIIIPEDIVEEIARIYGYHNLPSTLMKGEIPQTNYDSPFKFESKVRELLSSAGGCEIYTLSLISKHQEEENSLKLKNPLGSDTEYLRTSLKNSLIQAITENKAIDTKIHLYEIANTYVPKRGDLPVETMTLSGIFANHDYRNAKGVVEAFLRSLHINFSFSKAEINGFASSKSTEIHSIGNLIGKFGVLKNDYIYYEFKIEVLRKLYKQFPTFNQIPKFPSQIEDLTLILPEKTMVGEVLTYIEKSHELISKVVLNDIYNDAYTFRIWYQSPDKTLENSEIEIARKLVIDSLQKKFDAEIK